MKMKNILLIINSGFFMLFLLLSCENTEVNMSGSLTEVSEDILQGDSAYLTVEFNGGEPPFAFRYYFMDVNPSTGIYGKQYRYIMGISDRKYTFGLLPQDSITYIAESVACYYDNVGPATGKATFNVIPVDYIKEETIGAIKTGYIQKSVNSLNFSTGQLQLKKDETNFARTVYFEFDAADFQKIEEKNRYILRFWLISSHTSGVNKSSVMEVSGKVGALDDNMTWDSQPLDTEMTRLFSINFRPSSTSQEIEFTGDITPIVVRALRSPDSKKFTLRILENIDGKGNGGMFYIGGNLHVEDRRPYIDLQLRRKKTD